MAYKLQIFAGNFSKEETYDAFQEFDQANEGAKIFKITYLRPRIAVYE
jgi:hypothetical protein